MKSDWRYETDAPWVTWRFLSTDRETRITGRARVEMLCLVCRGTDVLRPRIPRFGPVPIPPGGVHPERTRWKLLHSHPDQRHPSDWAMPLRNPAAWADGIPLSVFENVARTAQMETETRDDVGRGPEEAE